MSVIINNLEIRDFAPVMIPTLCRFKHLKHLLESLAHCRWADHTEVYVALDYPVKESHWDGYNKIKEFLKCIDNMGFKKIHVVERERNYGFGPNGNAITLERELFSKYSRVIFTEDDNVFAYNFLEYINYNLEKYKDDKTVFAVCGYMYPVQKSVAVDATVLRLDQFSAWGYGTWKDRNEIYNEWMNCDKMKEALKDKRYVEYFEKHRLVNLCSLVNMSKGGAILGDSLITSIQVYSGMRSVFPMLSLVRNEGWDGSGMHGGCVPLYFEQEINKSEDSYQFIEANEEVCQEMILKVFKWQKSTAAPIQYVLSTLTWYLYKFSGIYYGFDCFRKLWRKIRK